MNNPGVSPPDFSKKTIPELIDELTAGQVGSQHHSQAVLMLQFRINEQQVEATRAQSKSTDAQAKASDSLVNSTRRLAIATWGLVFAAIVQCIITLFRK